MIGGNNPAAQFVAVATDVLNDIFAIASLYFAAQTADGFFQGSRIVEFGIEPHDPGDLIVTEQSTMDQGFEDFHFDEGDFQFFAIAENAHPILVQNEFAVVQTIRLIEKRID